MVGSRENDRGSVQNTVGAWVLALASIGTLASLAYGYVHDVERRFASLESGLAAVQAEHNGHIINAREWKDRIVGCETAIASIRSEAASRYDPFTGTQGREHNTRIRAVEALTPQIKHNTEAISRLEGRRTYHYKGRVD